MCSSGPKAPKQTVLPPPATNEIVDPMAMAERERDRSRQRAANGRQSTMLASAARGYMPPTGQAKTAMGA